MNVNVTQINFIRALKGPSASILIALVMFRRRFRPDELELLTGYSAKSIEKGLALLEIQGLVIDHGPDEGWELHDEPNRLGVSELSDLDGLRED